MHYALPVLVILLLSACSAPPTAQTNALTEQERSMAMARGDSIAQATFAALTQSLQKAMADGGPVSAVDYCWGAARPITDSLSARHGVRVKRTSNRLRSPSNKADVHESERMKEALAHLSQGNSASSLSVQVYDIGDSIAYYKPILIGSPLCLKCHGSPGTDLDSAAYALIKERYPLDEAIGYALGEFRGFWSIRWPRTASPQ